MCDFPTDSPAVALDRYKRRGERRPSLFPDTRIAEINGERVFWLVQLPSTPEEVPQAAEVNRERLDEGIVVLVRQASVRNLPDGMGEHRGFVHEMLMRPPFEFFV